MTPRKMQSYLKTLKESGVRKGTLTIPSGTRDVVIDFEFDDTPEIVTVPVNKLDNIINHEDNIEVSKEQEKKEFEDILYHSAS